MALGQLFSFYYNIYGEIEYFKLIFKKVRFYKIFNSDNGVMTSILLLL